MESPTPRLDVDQSRAVAPHWEIDPDKCGWLRADFRGEPVFLRFDSAFPAWNPPGWEEELRLALHRTLSRLSGVAPDEVVATVRAGLARDAPGRTARRIASAARTFEVPLLEQDVYWLGFLLDGAELPVAGAATFPDFRFVPVRPESLPAGARVGRTLDMTALPSELAPFAEALSDGVDAAVVSAVRRLRGVVGVWRTFRYRRRDPSGPGARVYLIETTPTEYCWAVAHEAHEALVAAGEESPRVEVATTGARLPFYQVYARAGAALLWARTGGVIRRATLHDGLDAAGEPVFAPDRPRLPFDAESERLVRYLRSGAVVRTTGARLADVVDPRRGHSVPLTFRTDGRWVWPEAVAYYLAEYGLAPHPEFAAYLRGTSGLPRAADGVVLFRADIALREED